MPFEFEDIVSRAHFTSDSLAYLFPQNLSPFWYARWSKQGIAIFQPVKGPKAEVTFDFFVPRTDTLDVKLFLTYGAQFGTYSYSLDGKLYGVFEGYKKFDPSRDPEPSDTLHLGTIFFEKDTHKISFACLGRDTAASEYRLGADLLLLTPAASDANNAVSTYGNSTFPNIILFPNPLSKGELIAGCAMNSGTPYSSLEIIILDMNGKKVASKTNIPFLSNTAQTRFDVHTFSSGNYVAEFIIHSGLVTQQISRLVQIRE